jgi:DNA-directed RNA polymerase alpha subunit
MISQINSKLWVNFDNIASIQFDRIFGSSMANKQIVKYTLKDSKEEFIDESLSCHLRWEAAIKASNCSRLKKQLGVKEGIPFSEITIDNCPFTSETIRCLNDNGIYRLKDLKKHTENSLCEFHGIGRARASKIMDFVSKIEEKDNG